MLTFHQFNTVLLSMHSEVERFSFLPLSFMNPSQCRLSLQSSSAHLLWYCPQACRRGAQYPLYANSLYLGMVIKLPLGSLSPGKTTPTPIAFPHRACFLTLLWIVFNFYAIILRLNLMSGPHSSLMTYLMRSFEIKGDGAVQHKNTRLGVRRPTFYTSSVIY